MPRFAANLTMLFNEVEFLERFGAARQSGFRGVEYLFPYPYKKEELAERLEEFGLTQVLHNLPAGDWAKGERGIACLPERSGEFREGVATAIEYARALRCRQLNCLAGIAPAGAEPRLLRETLVGNLRFAADIYHMQIMEGDLTPTMLRSLGRIAHLQLADNPGRHEPGTGEINYPFLFRTLDEARYPGWIGCEYKPLTTTAAGLGWLRSYL